MPAAYTDVTFLDVLKVASVILWSGLKFFFGVLQAVAFNFGFWQSVLFTVLGGMSGVFAFAFLDKPILRLWRSVFPSKKSNKVKFTRFKRWVVRVKNTYGLTGIALLTPILLQVPIGTILAMRLIKDIRKVSLYMLGAFILYSLILCGTFYFILGPEQQQRFLNLFHVS